MNMEQKNLVLRSFHDKSLHLTFVVSSLQTNSFISSLKMATILQKNIQNFPYLDKIGDLRITEIVWYILLFFKEKIRAQNRKCMSVCFLQPIAKLNEEWNLINCNSRSTRYFQKNYNIGTEKLGSYINYEYSQHK